MLQHVHAKTSVLASKLHSVITARALGNENCDWTLATTTTEEPPALSSQHTYFNKTWDSCMQKTLRYLCLLFAISICTYLTALTSAIAHTATQSDGMNNGSNLAHPIMLSNEPTTTYHLDHAANDYFGTGTNIVLYPNPIGSGSSETTTGPLSIDSIESSGIRINIGENLGQSQSVNPNTDSDLLFAQATPVPEVSISNNVNYIAEGSNATFTVTATTLPSANIEVNVEFTVDGDFIGTGESNNSTKTATITSSGDKTGRVSFTTKADSPDGNHGLVTATLATGTGYTLVTDVTKQSASIAVIDTLPKISIKPLLFADEADGYVNFMLESDFQPIAGRDIEITGLRVRDSNQFPPVYNPQLPQTPVLVTNANYNAVEVRVTLTKDPDFERWTGIVLDLDSGDEYLTNDPLGEQRTVTIREEQLAPTKFSIDAPDYIFEGEELTFNLTTEQAIGNEGFSVTVTIQHNVTTEPRTVQVQSSPTEVTIQTAIQTGSADSEIQLSIERGERYDPDPTNGSKTITVQDKDILPKVSIALAGAATGFNEGDNVTFELSASAVTPAVPSFTAYVQLTDDNTHDFLAVETTTIQHAVTLSSGGTGPLVIPTVADEVDEGNGGTIIATVQADPNLTDNTKRTTYLLSTTNPTSVTATIIDNDGSALPNITPPTSTHAQSLPQISLGFTMVDGRIGSTEAVEGEIALFSIQSDRVVSRALDVTVNVSQTGNFIGTVRTYEPLASQYTHGVLGINAVTIAAGRKVAFIGIATNDDQIDEENGTISVLLAKDSSYSVKLDNPSDRQKTINVNDNDDEPVFSLATKYTKVSDSDFFEVSVIPSIKSEKQFAISLSITPPSDLTGLIATANQSATVNVAPLASAQIHKIDIASVATNTANGHPVTVVINSSELYTVDHSKRQVQVNIVDDDSLPSPTISAVNSTVNEGEPAIFNIGFTNANTTPTKINLALTSEGNYLNGLTSDTIVVPAGATSYNYAIPTIRDSGAGGSVTVTLEPGDGYKLPNSPSAMVAIATSGSTQIPVMFIENKSDGDSNVVKSVVVGSSGENAEFTVFSNNDHGSSAFSVSYLATNLDGDFLGNDSSSMSIADKVQTAMITFTEIDNSSPPLFSGSLRVPVIQSANRKSGTIQVTLLDPTGSTYSVYKQRNQATMRVISTSSSLPVISITGGGRFEEGQDGIFYVQADRKPSETITVTVGISTFGTGSFLSSANIGNKTLEISSTTPVPLSIPTEADSTDESDGTVTATIQADPAVTDTYEVSANNDASIMIVDNDSSDTNIPVVEVSTLASRFEGSPALFNFTATPVPTQPLIVNFDLLIEGNMVENVIGPKSLNRTVTIPTSGQIRFEQPTVADTVVEDAGRIAVSIRASETIPASYSVGANYKASNWINDNDEENTVGVSVIAGGDIVEGENAFFTIRTDRAIDTPIPVRILISRTGTFFDHILSPTETITLPVSESNSNGGSQSAYIYHIPTSYDQVDEPDGFVRVSLERDNIFPARYSIGASPRATVYVKDDDEPGIVDYSNENKPVISILSNFTRTGVTINYPLNISVHSHKPVENDLLVLVRGKRSDDYTPYFSGAVSNVIRYIRIRKGSSRASMTFHFYNCPNCLNTRPPGNYEFTLEVYQNAYILNEQKKTVVINVKDNGATHGTLPKLSIATTGSNSINYGDTARFTITSDKAPTEDLEINYWVSYDRVFSDNNLFGMRSITLKADSITPTSVVLEIPTLIPDNTDPNTTLTVQLRDGVGYVRSENQNNIDAGVVLREKVLVSIKSQSVPAVEGESINFTFLLSKPLTGATNINVRVSDPGNYLTSTSRTLSSVMLDKFRVQTDRLYHRNTPDKLTNLSGQLNYFHQLITELDGEITAPNTIRVEILPSDDYEIGTNSVAEVKIRDGNTNITIVPVGTEVERGNNATFRITATTRNLTAANQDITVKLGVEAEPSTIYSGSKTVTEDLTIINGSVSEDITITTTSDTNSGFDFAGSLKVFVKNPDGRDEETFSSSDKGAIYSDYLAEVWVIDDDVSNGVSIYPFASQVIEGDLAIFQIIADSATQSDRTINLIGSRYLPNTVTLPANHKSVIVSATTPYNPIHQEPGEVILSIDTGSDYTPSTTNFEARMVLLDAIVPEFRLVRSTLRVPEFSFFDLEFAANPVPQVDYNVKFSFSSGYQDDLIPFQSSYTFKAGESSLIITRVPPAVTKDELQVWSISIEPADLTQGRGRAHFTLPITILNFGTDATLTKPKVAVSPIDFAVEEGSVASFKISVDHGDKMFNTVENNKIVNKVSSTVPPTLVHFRLIVEGDPLPDYFTYPDPSDYSSTKNFNTALGEYREKLFTEVPSLSGCTSYENLRFSCWVHESRNGQRIFNFPTVANESAQKRVGVRILVGEEQLLTNYLPDPTAAFSSIEVLPGALPVITVNSIATLESGRSLEITFHAEPRLTRYTTITFEVEDPAGLLRYGDRHNYGYHFGFNRRNSPFVMRMYNTDDDRNVGIGTKKDTSNFLPDGLVTVRVLPDPDYIVGPTTGSDNAKTSVTSTLIYHTNSPPGGISIIAPNGTINSGEPALFNIKRTTQTGFDEDTMIPVVISQDGSDVIAGPRNLTRQVLIPKGDYSGFLRLDTMDLPYSSESRTITATLQSDPNNSYTLTTENEFRTASITVSLTPKTLIATVKNGNYVASNGYLEGRDTVPNILEGQIAHFEITLSLPEGATSYQSPEDGFYLYYTVTTENGKFLYSDDTVDFSGTQKIKIKNLNSHKYPKFDENNAEPGNPHNRATTEWKYLIPVQTQIDKESNTNGKITLTLLDDTSNPAFYELGSDAQTKTTSIAVANDHRNAPTIAISKGVDPTTEQQVDSITEGGVYYVRLLQ